MNIDEALVRDARARIIATGLADGNVHADFGEPTQDTPLPHVNVFVPVDDAAPDGDARTGIARYTHATQLIVEVIEKGNSVRAIKAYLAAVSEGLMQTLLSDVNWAALDGVPFIEGFGKVKRVYAIPPDGNHFIGRLQIQIEVLHRTSWEPDVSGLPDLSSLSVGIDMDNGDDAPEVGAEIVIPPA